MNPLDILMIVILTYCVVMGFFRGLMRELAATIGVLGGFYAAYTYYMNVSKYLSKWISDPSYLNILSFLIIFFSVFIIISILGVIIKYLLKIITFGWMDRISGGGCGLIKGLLIVSVVLMTLITFLPKGSPIIRDSMLSPSVTPISEKMAKVISKDMKREFTIKIRHFKKAWKMKS
ncbi:MAG TPA: CvpA family protein [Desulfobacterales bacterium]|nr:CvpA family protein [Desulfobacterales bacterium]